MSSGSASWRVCLGAYMKGIDVCFYREEQDDLSGKIS